MIYENIIEIGQSLERRATATASMTSGLSYTEMRLLSALENGPQTRTDLATLVGLTPSAISRALGPLEKLGFVVSARDGRDARQSRAQLTEAGAERLGDAQAAVAAAWEGLALDFGSINEADVANLREQLSQPRPRQMGNRPAWAVRADPPAPQSPVPDKYPGIQRGMKTGIKIGS